MVMEIHDYVMVNYTYSISTCKKGIFHFDFTKHVIMYNLKKNNILPKRGGGHHGSDAVD